MLSKRALATGQYRLRELSEKAEERYNSVKWEKEQAAIGLYHQGFLLGQAAAYSRAADLIGEYFGVRGEHNG